MKILLVGGGGREHALAWALHRHGHSLTFTDDNPAFAALGTVRSGDPLALAAAVDLVVIGPEAPLAAGLVNRLHTVGIPAFGPTADAARLESSKIFGKRFCARQGLPAPGFTVVEAGSSYTATEAGVVKLDGLAAGKGVWVCNSAEETTAAVRMAQQSRPEAAVLIEEKLSGRELSLLAISDGERVVCLPGVRDHKRRYDGDRGPNTGGMGAVAPVPVPELEVCEALMARAVAGMAAEGTPFRGVLYGGFMLSPRGPELLEFNVRFGDPECQPLMMLWAEDPAPWFFGAATGKLPPGKPKMFDGAACCVVVCGEGYPDRPAHAPILALPADRDDAVCFQAGTKRIDRQLWATGGRVLGLTARGATPEEARQRAYAMTHELRFEGASWRLDIGA